MMPVFAVSRVKYDKLSSVGQYRRRGPARPTVLSFAKQMRPSLFAQCLNLLKRYDKQLRVMSKLERIEPLVVAPQPRKLAQALRPDLMMTSFLSWR